MPFSRVVKTALEQTSVALDPAAYIIGGVPAAKVDFQFRPRHDYSNSVLIICGIGSAQSGPRRCDLADRRSAKAGARRSLRGGSPCLQRLANVGGDP
jgi:hypothetical protein